MRYKRRSHRDYDDDDESIGDDLAAINDRLDNLTRQLERVATKSSSRRSTAQDEEDKTDRVAEALARLDRRLDEVIAEARSAPIEAQRRALAAMVPPPAPQQPAPPPLAFAPPPQSHPVPPPAMAVPPVPPQPAPASFAAPQPAPNPIPPPQPVGSAPNWAAEIAARQRVLDGGPAAAMRAPAPTWSAPAQAPAPTPAPTLDLSALEHQLRQITTQIASLHQPYEDALSALRGDLAEVSRALQDAMPRHAVEALEAEVRALSERIGRSKQNGADPTALAGLEQGLAEVRDALRTLAPAENLIGFEDAVRGLSHRIDQLSTQSVNPEPAVFHQLEEAIAAMRHIGSHVASDGALAQLAAEVHGLATRFEHATEANTGNESLARLESRIAALMESGRSVPPDLEDAIRSLSERLDRIQTSQGQLSQGDQLALSGLEDRIVKLVERLDACDARLGGLDAIERGLADVLVHLEEMRKANARAARMTVVAPPEVAPAPAPAPAAPASAAPIPAAPQLQTPPVVAAPPAPPPQTSAVEPPPAPVAPQATPAPAPKPAPPRAERRPINPDLPPDTPLEPGSGVPHSKPGSPAARIAASEALLAGTRPGLMDAGGKSAAIAAARNAAMAYQAETPDEAPRRSILSWFKPKQPKLPKPPKPPKPKKAEKVVDPFAPKLTTRQKVLKHLKTLIIATSVVIIILGTLQTAMDFFMAPQPSQTQTAPTESSAPVAPAESGAPVPPAAPETAPAATPPAIAPSGRTMPTPEGTPPAAQPSAEPGSTGTIGPNASMMFDPTTVLSVKRPPASADVTGSIPRQAADPANALPSSFGPALSAAAAKGDHGAEYEIAARYAEGRGVARNPEQAIHWLKRAAKAGFVPAQFRLAGVYEKGEGVKKDLTAARKLYLDAADKGHAKAMHNLAVLYAEGVNGRPDYANAPSGSARRRPTAWPTASSTWRSFTRAASGSSRTSRNPTNGSRLRPTRATRTPPGSATKWRDGSTRRP